VTTRVGMTAGYLRRREPGRRRSLIKPQVAFVVAALGLAPDAKKELDENSESAAITLMDSASKLPDPVIMENLDHLGPTLIREWTKHEEMTQRYAVVKALSGLASNVAYLLTDSD
jgi:hypothetical protein